MSPKYVLQATAFIEYTPSEDILPYSYCTFYISEDADVSFVDIEGNVSEEVPMSKGYHPILVQKITAVSAGTVYYMKHEAIS